MGMKKKKIRKTTLPKQARSIKSKENILIAAQHIFSEKGYYGARVDDIAALVQVNKQRIYAYFGSKEQLHRQVILKVYSQAANNDRIMKLSKQDLPRMTAILVETFIEFHRSNPQFWRLLAWENLLGGESLMKSDWNNIRASYIDHLRMLYKAGQAKKIFRGNIDFSTYLITIFSITYFYYSNQLTISHLLNLKLGNIKLRESMMEQVNLMLNTGVTLPECR